MSQHPTSFAPFRRRVAFFGRAAIFAALAIAPAFAVACSGAATQAPVAAPTLAPKPVIDVDADPVALLPFGPLGLAYIDGHVFANSTNGGDLTAIVERVVPFARDIDFVAKRDLQSVYMAAYSFSGADALAVVTGTFQTEKIELAATKGLNTPFGLAVGSTYAGRKIYTVSNNGFCVLSAKTALIGTETAIRRALDRIQAGTVNREVGGWMGDWVLQTGYPFTMVADVTKQSFGKTVTSMLPWVQGMQYVRTRGRFNADGSFGMSGALTFPDATKAQAASDGLGSIPKGIMYMAALKAIGIDPLFRKMECSPAGNDVQFSTVVDEKGTRQLVKLLSEAVGSALPAGK